MGAFGKDDSKKAIGGNFRQRNAAMQDHRRQEHTSKGGGGRRFSDVYRLNKEDYDIVRLVPGNFTFTGGNKDGTTYDVQLEYWPYWSHFFSFGKDGNEGKGTICSGGTFHFIPGKGELCVGCKQEAEGAKNVSKSDKYAFSLIHFASYHKIPSTDDKGNVRKSQGGETYYDWVRCGGRNKCDHCKTALETRPFHRMHVSLSFMQYKSLTTTYADLVGDCCVNCRGRDTIQWKYWVCTECGEIIFERGVTDLEDSEVRKETLKEIKCPTCKNVGFLDEVVECTKCSDPKRATIFDVDLHIKGEPAGRGKGLNLIVGKYSEPHPLDPAVPEELREPLDLPKVYQPDSIQRQAETARIKLEPGQGSMSQEVRPYGGETPDYGRK